MGNEEQEFLQAIGLERDDLAWLVADAPPVPSDVTERVLASARQKTSGARKRTLPRLRRWAAAAAVVLGLGLAGSAAVAVSPGAQAALKGLLRLVPGFGAEQVQAGSLVLAAPVTVADGNRHLTVTGLLSNDQLTEVRLRWDGFALPYDKPTDKVEDPEAELVLPDGRRLHQTGAGRASGPDDPTVVLDLTFPGLPAGVRQVQLELSAAWGVTNRVSVPIALKEAIASGTAGLVESNRSATDKDVKVTVSYVAFDGDRIRVTMATGPLSADRAADLGMPNSITLTDDLGNTYPYVWRESLIRAEPAAKSDTDQSFTAFFAGPLHQGARTLHVSISSVLIREPGHATLDLPVGALDVGQSQPVNQTLQVGRFPFTFTQVTRTAANNYRIEMTPPAMAPGSRLWGLRPELLGVRHTAMSVTPGQGSVTIEIEGAEIEDHLWLLFTDPTISQEGNWSVDVPVP